MNEDRFDMTWEKVKIKSIWKGFYDGPHATPPVCENGGIFLGISNITPNGHIDLSDIKYISEEDLPKWTKRVVPQEGDIVFSYEATLNLYAIIPEGFHGCLGRRMALIRVDEKKASNRFLFYYFFSKEWRTTVAENTIVGSTVDRIPIAKFPEFPITLPPLIIQQKIASILSAYDNLIENNNKRIKILEQMAENLYKEWFVRFRFPGHETTRFTSSNMGKIPSTFTLAKMQDVFEYYIGGGWGEDEYSTDFPVEAKVIRGTDFPFVERGDLGTCPNRFHKESNYNARKLEPGDIILEVSGGTAEQPVGRTILVSQQMLDRFNGQVICASFCKLVRLKKEKISPVYFYYWMQFLYETRIIDRFQLQSTGIINFKFEYFLKKGDVMLPPSKIMKDFENLVSPIHAQIEKLAMETENLIKQRDLLLPRLMSGKLAV